MINEAMIDQVGTKALTTAIGVLGPRLAKAVSKPRGQRADDLSIAHWFETYRITKNLPDLPGLTPQLAKRLAEVLNSDSTQAALQVLLASRLTNADDVETGRARQVFCLTLATADPELSQFGPPLAEYYDDEISSMAARLEAAEPTLFTQIRSEAFSTRMLAILRAIERHAAALSAQCDVRSEASFLASYSRHVLDEHGRLKPPDFDRRRLVPIRDIYVPAIIYEDANSKQDVTDPAVEPPTFSVWDLARRVDRTVLLGDPGGGKTTASHVLMYHFASGKGRRIPFLVTLRNYAVADPPQHSIVDYIETELKTFYQCSAPPGLVGMLLLTGRAIVIFDGLDELLDTSRRMAVASRVEHFCLEYPLASVLVTSRVVGYDQARLDESQFTSYRLGGFRDKDVATYARKWFALQGDASQDDAEAFIVESESVPDLRTNPLLLSLMCILYRGEGSLPRNRAEVYEQCAKLLFKRWDSHRHIHQELRAGRYVEQILRHLAWWLFTRDNTQTSVTERELVAVTTDFLHGRGFESENDAREAALQFIEFSCGRLWVFNDAGTNVTGEKLYAFTHRTFLEYFAASQLAYDCDTPEKLARLLSSHVARGEWEIVSELAVQVKDTTSREGARRIYEILLDERRRRSLGGRSNILCFLAQTLRSVTPSPQTIRRLTNEVVGFLFNGDPGDPIHYMPIWQLLTIDTPSLDIISEEITSAITDMIDSSDPEIRLNGARLSVALDHPANGIRERGRIRIRTGPRIRQFWFSQALEVAHVHRDQILAEANHFPAIINSALIKKAITIGQALDIPGALESLVQPGPVQGFLNSDEAVLVMALLGVIYWKSGPKPSGAADSLECLRAVGKHLVDNPAPPWAAGLTARTKYAHTSYSWGNPENEDWPELDPIANLGGFALLLILTEAKIVKIGTRKDAKESQLGPFKAAKPYIARRARGRSVEPIPELPVPEQFRQIFRDWAEGKINFI